MSEENKKNNDDLAYIKYFEQFAKEDADHIINICETASKQIWDRFRARFTDPRLLAVVFSKIFGSVLDYLVSQENEYSDYKINVCGRLEIGYSTSDDEDDEKQGNYMIFIRHLNAKTKNDSFDDPTAKSRERSVQWNTENIIENPVDLRKISELAVKALSDIGVKLGVSELVMPIFITVYEATINYLKICRREKDEFEFEINFISCFNIGARESEDEVDDIYIRPSIDSKLKFKNDAEASGKFE